MDRVKELQKSFLRFMPDSAMGQRVTWLGLAVARGPLLPNIAQDSTRKCHGSAALARAEPLTFFEATTSRVPSEADCRGRQGRCAEGKPWRLLRPLQNRNRNPQGIGCYPHRQDPRSGREQSSLAEIDTTGRSQRRERRFPRRSRVLKVLKGGGEEAWDFTAI